MKRAEQPGKKRLYGMNGCYLFPDLYMYEMGALKWMAAVW